MLTARLELHTHSPRHNPYDELTLWISNSGRAIAKDVMLEIEFLHGAQWAVKAVFIDTAHRDGNYPTRGRVLEYRHRYMIYPTGTPDRLGSMTIRNRSIGSPLPLKLLWCCDGASPRRWEGWVVPGAPAIEVAGEAAADWP